MVGAILKELELRKKIAIRQRAKIQVLDSTPTGEQILDHILNSLTSNNYNAKRWARRLGYRNKGILSLVWNQLEVHGIVKYQKRKYILIKPQVRNNLINSIRNTITNELQPNANMSALLGYLFHMKMWGLLLLLPRRERKWLKQVTNYDHMWYSVFRATKERAREYQI